MIVVTRLNGPQFAVNPDLLQRIESTPDTILTLIDGTKYIVAESMDEVTRLVIAYRARVVAATMELTGEETTLVAAVSELRPDAHHLDGHHRDGHRADAHHPDAKRPEARTTPLRAVPEVD